MKSWYRVFPKALTAHEAAGLSASAQTLPCQEAVVGFGGESRKDNGLRKSGVRWIPRVDPTLDWLWKRIEHFTWKANHESFDNIDIQYFPDVQFTTYRGDEAGHYGPHQDNTFLATHGQNWDRKISVCIQMSDRAAYEGGEFWVNPSRPVEVTDFKDAGDMIVFPSILWHEVKPVTSGVRNSLVLWWQGPRWR